ncbi:MAG: PspC domain-containing protein [Ignavibacteria bacterium]|nr:PspC domain-containing protein [Ignavibacteria bacterium]
MIKNDKIIGGVCKRIADYFGINTTLTRVFWILLTIVTFIILGLLVYIVLWFTEQPKSVESK